MPLNFPITPQLAQPTGATSIGGLENYLRFFLRDLQQYLYELGLSLSTVDLTNLGVSAYIQTLLDDADASTALTTLGVSNFIKTLLDDTTAAAALTTLGFETGTWSPTMAFGTPGSSSFSYGAQAGTYIKIPITASRSLIYVDVLLNFTPTIGTGTGELRISLPFAGDGLGTIALKGATAGFAWPANTTMMTFVVSNGVTYGRMFSEGPAITAGALQTTALTSGVAAQVEFGGTYRSG